MFWLHETQISISELWEHVDFRMLAAYDVVAAPGWRIEFEKQGWTELWFIREGRCEVVQDSKRIMACAGDAVLLRTGKTRRTLNPDDATFSVIGFSCNIQLAGGIDPLCLLDLPLSFRLETSRIRLLMESIVNEGQQQRPGRTFALHGWAQLALVEVLRSCEGKVDNSMESQAGQQLHSGPNPEILRVLQFVENHFVEELDVTCLARVAHLSDKHFSRRFKSAVGATPMEFVRRYRLQRAAQRLAACDEPIAVTAIQSGFVDAAHFSRVFKNEFGMTPFSYRGHLRAMMPRINRNHHTEAESSFRP